MSKSHYLSQWCQIQGVSLPDLAEQSSVPIDTLRAWQTGSLDPPLSLLETVAATLQIPTAWLHSDPQTIQRLWNDPEEDDPTLPDSHSPDPLFQRIFQTSREYQDLYILLTSLIHHGDPKLIRAAHVNLQSLFKQARNVSIPWGSRPPGHFEPPNE